MMTPNDMLTFLAVAETGSFTRAADVLMTPKSNVSRRITRLEDQLGVRLLERTTRKLNLTEAGLIYLEHSQRVREELEGAKLNLESLTRNPSGTLKVCTTVTVGQSLLAQPLIKFQQHCPNVNLELKFTNRRVDLIEEGFDLAIRVGSSTDSSLISRRLCTVSMHLYASPAYLTQYETLIRATQLSDHSCLYMNSLPGKPQWPLLKSSEQISIQPAFSCDDFNMIHQTARAGLGLALLPDYLCKDSVRTGQLVQVLDGIVGREVPIYAIYPSKKGKLPKLSRFLEFLLERLK